MLVVKIILDCSLQQLHTSEKDWNAAMNIMGMGADYALSVRSEYTRLLFMLSRGMVSDRVCLLIINFHVGLFG